MANDIFDPTAKVVKDLIEERANNGDETAIVLRDDRWEVRIHKIRGAVRLSNGTRGQLYMAFGQRADGFISSRAWPTEQECITDLCDIAYDVHFGYNE